MDEGDKWRSIHGPMKTMVHTVLSGLTSTVGYLLTFNSISIVEQKSDLRSNELKRLWVVWDLAWERWEKELGLHGYRDSSHYKLFNHFKKLLFTIIDNDGPYLKLVYQFLRAWEDVKEMGDEVLK